MPSSELTQVSLSNVSFLTVRIESAVSHPCAVIDWLPCCADGCEVVCRDLLSLRLHVSRCHGSLLSDDCVCPCCCGVFSRKSHMRLHLSGVHVGGLCQHIHIDYQPTSTSTLITNIQHMHIHHQTTNTSIHPTHRSTQHIDPPNTSISRATREGGQGDSAAGRCSC